jgi:hypothetical protein
MIGAGVGECWVLFPHVLMFFLAFFVSGWGIWQGRCRAARLNKSDWFLSLLVLVAQGPKSTCRGLMGNLA